MLSNRAMFCYNASINFIKDFEPLKLFLTSTNSSDNSLCKYLDIFITLLSALSKPRL